MSHEVGILCRIRLLSRLNVKLWWIVCLGQEREREREREREGDREGGSFHVIEIALGPRV